MSSVDCDQEDGDEAEDESEDVDGDEDNRDGDNAGNEEAENEGGNVEVLLRGVTSTERMTRKRGRLA